MWHCISIASLSAQDDTDWVLRFENLTVEDRLPSHRVLCVCQDYRGFMWFGTEEGLCRYDGFSFTEYMADLNNSLSISNNAVRSITEDSFGNLWIGTDGGGLNYFIPEKEEFYQFPLPNVVQEESLNEHDKIYSILRTSDNKYWIGSYGQGIYLLPAFSNANDIILFCKNNKPDNIIQFLPDGSQTGLNDAYVFCLYEDRAKTLWIGTDGRGSAEGGALHKIIQTSKEKKKLICTQFRHDPTDIESLGSNYIMSLFEDSKSRLWVANWEGGLNLLDRETGKVQRIRGRDNSTGHLNNDDVYCVVEDHYSNLWVATYGGGISRVSEKKPGQFEFITQQNLKDKENSLVGDFVRQIFVDQGGLLWVITWKSGISRLRVSRNPFIHVPLPDHGISDTITEVVQRIQSDDAGRILIETQKQGLLELNLTKEGQRTNYIFSQSKVSFPPDPIYNTYIGSRFSSDSIFIRVLDGKRIFYEDSRNNLWIGRGSYLVKCYVQDSAELKIIEYERDSRNPVALKGYQVTGITEDSRGMIWISTMDALNRFDPNTGQFEYFTMKDGLPGNAISAMLTDSYGYLWLATENGIARFDTESLISIIYDEDDGLPFTDFANRTGYGMEEFQNFPAFASLPDGSFIFSTIQYGLLLFHPDEVYTELIPPPVWITELRILNQTVRAGDWIEGRQIIDRDISFVEQLVLKPKDQSFTIAFSELDFFNSEKTRYAYRLLPLEQEWIFSGADNRQVTYSHLPPGDFTFELKGANSHGVWNPNIRELKIFIKAPWYRTLWFKLMVLLCIVLVATLAIIFFKQRAIIYQELELERFRRKESDRFTQMRIRFYTNVTHEFRTPLSLILGPAEKLQNADTDPARLQEDISLIKRNALRLLNLVNQLMDFRKIETNAVSLQVEEGDVSEYISGIADLFRENAVSREIDFNVSTNPDKIIAYFDHGAVDKIIFNLLSNAFKFTGKQGQIQIRLERFEKTMEPDLPVDWLRICISDTGKGIPKDMLPRIFDRFFQAETKVMGSGVGLSIVRNLVSIHHGEIRVISELEKGTSFYVELPIARIAFSDEEISNRKNKSIELARFRSTVLPDFSKTEKLKDDHGVQDTAGNKTILIIEDNVDMLQFISDLLQKHFNVRSASSAEEGLEIIKEEEPDIILSDVMMPGIGGLNFVQKIKNNISFSHIPIILITSLTGKSDEIAALKCGADDYISKPFDPEILLAKIVNRIKTREQFILRFSNLDQRKIVDPSLGSKDQDFLKNMMGMIEESYSNPDFSVKDLVGQMGMSHSVLFRKVKSITGQNINDMLVLIRLEKAHELLTQENVAVKEVAYQVGFSDPKYFSTRFKKKFGISPSRLGDSLSRN